MGAAGGQLRFGAAGPDDDVNESSEADRAGPFSRPDEEDNGSTLISEDARNSRLTRRTRRAGASPLPSSAYFLHTTNDSLPRSGLPGPDYAAMSSRGATSHLNPSPAPHLSSGPGPGASHDTSWAVSRARRHASLAASLLQFVAKLPPPSPGSAAAALRSKLGSRLAVGSMGVWVAQVAAALRDTRAGTAEGNAAALDSALPGASAGKIGEDATNGGASAQEQESSGAAPAGVSAGVSMASASSAALGAVPGAGADADADELLVEAMVAAQPQLLAQDSEVLAARLRGLAAVLGLAPAAALSLAASRPGLLLLDLPTLERRLDGLAAAMGLPDRTAAAAMARSQPAWLYADLPPRPQ